MTTVGFNRKISADAHQTMRNFVSDGHNIKWVAFHPPGGNRWSVIDDKDFANKNIPEECDLKMHQLVYKDNHRILCVAFPPAGGNRWSIITDKGFVNHDIPPDCDAKMNDLHNSDHKLLCVAFPPAGGNRWSIITDKGFVNHDIPPDCDAKMNDLHNSDHKLLCVAFPPAGGNRWSIITDKDFANHDIPPECNEKMVRYTKECHWPVYFVGFDADGSGWSIMAEYIPKIDPNAAELLKVNGYATITQTPSPPLSEVFSEAQSYEYRIDLDVTNTTDSPVTVQSLSLYAATSGGWVEWTADLFGSGEMFFGKSLSIPAFDTYSGSKYAYFKVDTSHVVICVRAQNGQGKHQYSNTRIPIMHPGFNSPIQIKTPVPLYIGLWTKPVEVVPVWVVDKKVNWLTLAGQTH